MTEKEKHRHYRASVHFSSETMRQANELEQIFQESRSRVISRAIDNLYQKHVTFAVDHKRGPTSL